MRRTHALLLAFFPLGLLGTPLLTAATPQIESSYGPLPVFEFHSGFWINLHHTLYQAAKQRAISPAAAPNNKATRLAQPVLKTSPSSLNTSEQKAWDDALSYYAANLIGQDLLFSTDMILLKNQ